MVVEDNSTQDCVEATEGDFVLELKMLVDNFFSNTSSCRLCPREVVAHNRTLATLHDACSCESDFTKFRVSGTQPMVATNKKSNIVIHMDNLTYVIPYRSLTSSSFVKAKTRKYCQKNSILGLLSSQVIA